MKKIAALFLCMAALTGCASSKRIDGKVVGTYGLLTRYEDKKDNVEYRISTGNVFWSIIFCETIIIPVWLIGFELYEPVNSK